MTRILQRGLVAALLVYLGFGAYLYAFQRSFLYYPTPAAQDPQFKQLDITSGNERIRVVQVNPGRPSAILYFGGNAEAVHYNGPDFARLFPHATSYLVNYRGYGGSTGTPTESGLYRDALAAYDAVRETHAAIAVIGRSLGTGVATYLAVNRPVERLVLITPYDSVEQLAHTQYPLYPMTLLLKDKFDSVSRAPSIRTPTLVLIAGRDQLVGPERAWRLVQTMDPQFVRAVVIDGANHFNLIYRPRYEEELRSFFSPLPAG